MLFKMPFKNYFKNYKPYLKTRKYGTHLVGKKQLSLKSPDVGFIRQDLISAKGTYV